MQRAYKEYYRLWRIGAGRGGGAVRTEIVKYPYPGTENRKKSDRNGNNNNTGIQKKVNCRRMGILNCIRSLLLVPRIPQARYYTQKKKNRFFYGQFLR